jgi:hypothetical protein
MSETDDEKKGFKVRDRRAFTSDGEPRDDEEPTPTIEKPESIRQPEPEKEEEAPTTSTDPVGGAPEVPGTQPSPGPPPDVGFMDLVNMLVSNALMQLGDMPDPVSGESVENLPGAQVMIALLTMLQEKTKGNLDKDEAKVLDEVLYDLRMRFLTKTNAIQR